jgi:hypothetical protein
MMYRGVRSRMVRRREPAARMDVSKQRRQCSRTRPASPVRLADRAEKRLPVWAGGGLKRLHDATAQHDLRTEGLERKNRLS